jgi:hypothetical protein
MDLREIYLTRGAVCLISAADYPRVSPYKWRLQVNEHSGKQYATTDILGRKVYLHRFLTNCPRGLVVDHEDGDGLHDWRENLRVTTHAFNQANCCAFGVVPYRGVTKDGRKFRARINDRHLGSFDDPADAARAYDAAALAEWGDFAWLNFKEARPACAVTPIAQDPPF